MVFRKITDRINRDPHFYTLLLFVVSGLLLYLNSFGSAWTYDDYVVILQNSDIRSLEGFWENKYPGRPMRELSFMVDHILFGFNPSGWHIQNILWHSINAWLVFCLSTLLQGKKSIAWIASILFFVHPLQVEVVAQMSHRKDSLALFFMLLACIFFYLFKRDKKIGYVLSSLTFMFLGFFAKENTFVLPAFLVISAAFIDRKRKNSLRANSPILFLLGLVTFGVVFWFVGWQGSTEKAELLLINNNYFEGFNFNSYLLAILNAWGHIFTKLVLPMNLSVNYVLEVPGSFLNINVVIALLLVAGYSVSIIYSAKKNEYLFFSLLWLGLFYLPTSNILPATTHLAADRYMYAPSVGFFMFVSYLVDRYVCTKHQLSFVVIITLVLSFLTVKQTLVWKDNVTLWTHSMQVNPHSARAVSNSGLLLYSSDDERRLEMQMRAKEINPYDPFIPMKIGEIYEGRGDLTTAQRYYIDSCKLYRPSFHGMYRRLFIEMNEKITEGRCFD